MKSSRVKPGRQILQRNNNKIQTIAIIVNSLIRELQETYVLLYTGILDKAMAVRVGLIILMVKFAFISGRSKHGKALRASIGEN